MTHGVIPMPDPRLLRVARIFTPQRRVRFFVALAFVLAAAFGLAAYHTVGVARDKVAAGTCTFAADAARVLQARSEDYLDAVADPIFAAAVGGRPPMPSGRPLPGPAALRAADSIVALCHCAPRLHATGYFRLDIRGDSTAGALTITGAGSFSDQDRDQPGAGEHAVPSHSGTRVDSIRLKEAVIRLVPAFRNGDVLAAPITDSPNDTTALETVAVLSPKYGADGQLRAIYGLLVDPPEFANEIVGPVFEGRSLFAWYLSPYYGRKAVGKRQSLNRQLANVAVMDYRGTLLYQTGPMPDSTTQLGCIGEGPTEASFANLMVFIGPPPGVLQQWVRNEFVESNLPFLGIILVAMLGCVAAAVLGARREADLARLRSDFVSSVSHEMRMPLAQILMSGETIRLGRTRSQAEHDGEIDSIVREAQHLVEVVDNALFFSRIEHHNLQLTLQPAELYGVAQTTVDNVQLIADGLDATIVNTVPRGLYASVDIKGFSHVLTNLVDNAIKYGPPGQVIQIGARCSIASAQLVLIWVEDEGPGIPEKERETIFKPFIRLRRDRNVGVAGSGLGLAVVQHIISHHDGRVWVEPSHRGTGSRFVIQIPVARGVVPDEAQGLGQSLNGDSTTAVSESNS